MPLSKKRDAERKREEKRVRLENLQFQPKYVIIEGKRVEVPELDADGNRIWEE